MTREEAIEWLNRELKVWEKDCLSKHPIKEALSVAIEALEQEPIRPKGKWISYHYGAYYECSNCHERNNSRYDNYCKFCGAEMEEVER